MVNYYANSPGDPTITFPSSLNVGDKITISPTGYGEKGTIVKWTVPVRGVYRLSAMGAAGGKTNRTGLLPGNGAKVSGEFILEQGEIINIVVGQQPSNSPYGGSGGGGGSFIYKGEIGNSGLLLVGGGGGGAGPNTGSGLNASATEDANNAATGTGNGGSQGIGKGGNGGLYNGKVETWNMPGGGGAGWLSNGENGQGSGDVSKLGYGGRRFAGGSGAMGIIHGGFGGGGGAGGSGYAGGGGGGYTGGGGGNNWDGSNHGGGGGGGSYNAGFNPINMANQTSGGGRVEIEYKEIPKKIQHIGSTSWSETSSYGGINGQCTWSVPSGVQVGDLIIVMAQSTGSIVNSSITNPSGYIKLGERTSNGRYGSSAFYKIATESDINSKVTFYTPKNSTGIGFGSINVYRNAKILSHDIVNTTGFTVPVPGQQEEVVLLEQVRGEYPTPKDGYTRIAKHGYTATTMHKYFYNTIMATGSADGESPVYTIPWVLIGYSEGNELPTKPESFTKQPTANSMNLSGESIQLEWTASTDIEGDVISYEVELYNGSTWSIVASNIETNSYSATLPKLDTDKAQFRVRAVDSKGGQSDYTLGDVFTIATRLLLIQDNSIVKSFKDGVWKAIQ